MPSTSAIAHMVHWIRHEKVMLDEDLAQLYGVTTGALNQAVKRNLDRFPDDFVFQLTAEEYHALRSQNVTLDIDEELGGLKSQIVISNTKAAQNQSSKLSQNVTSSRGGRKRSLPYAFTEQGVAMLSSVLRSPRAVEVNIAIMRTFVQLRRLMDSNRDLERKIETLEKKYDEQFAAIFHAIKQLIRREPESPPPSQPKRRIGYKTEESKL
ncbi:MAG: ORF6N domain-containing protein [Candidatus Sumerlaeaceae bacterium]